MNLSEMEGRSILEPRARAIPSRRQHADWLSAYIDYTKHSEAPTRMHFWAGVSAIAGALQRKVWLDLGHFKWYANFYIVFVAPPGVVAKSTTSGLAMNLLRRVEGVQFGPSIVTWQALVERFAAATIGWDMGGGNYLPMSSLTLESSEFGTLLDPNNREMVDLFVNLWDCKEGVLDKATKTSGNDKVENPWINMIACTTPAWIAGNFKEYIIGGGFTSRTVFVYAEKKQQMVAYPFLAIPEGLEARGDALVRDLQHIADTLTGPFVMTPDAVQLGIKWYEHHNASVPESLASDRFGGYRARKQTHIHKLAMVLSASEGDSMVITAEHLRVANEMLTDLEPDMAKVFAKVGKSDRSLHGDRVILFIQSKSAPVSFDEVYRHVYSHFPSMRDFEDVIAGAIKSGHIKVTGIGAGMKFIKGIPLQT